MNPDAFRMNRFTLRFADPAMEAVFADEQARKAVRPVRIALACLGALGVCWYVLTIHVFKKALSFFLSSQNRLERLPVCAVSRSMLQSITINSSALVFSKQRINQEKLWACELGFLGE